MKLGNWLLMALVAGSQLMVAQTEDSKFAVGLFGGLNEYNGDLGNGLFKFKDINPLGAISLSTYVSPSFNLGVQGSYGKYAMKSINPTFEGKEFSGNKYEGFMYLDYKLNNGYILSKSSKISPFLTAGIGLAGYPKGANINSFPMDLITPVGAGLKFQVSDALGIQYKYLYSFTNHDEHDNIRMQGKNDGYGEHLLGIVLTLCGDKDSDKDGVKDKKDKCPNTPLGVVVDANGCPLDGDGDGIADYLDKCPTVAGIAKFDGCPDSDGDGVQDSADKCPNTPSGVAVDAKGCPIDTDKDGIADYLDKCPNVAGIAKFDGCPDTDGDGIPDAKDECPTVPGLAKFNGCPDTDGDGIQDNLDKCPTVPGIPENKGCPPVKEETKKLFVQALQGIQFETGKDVIRPKSYPILDQVVKVMSENPQYLLGINGHTDSQGADDFNMTLSDKRAAAVKKYLVDKGVDAAKLTSKGYGETKPVADNSTASGRAKNRRVEFKIDF